MIEVIKHGNKRQIMCGNCMCVFNAEKEDMNDRQVGFNEFETYVTCPDCKNEIVLN